MSSMVTNQTVNNEQQTEEEIFTWMYFTMYLDIAVGQLLIDVSTNKTKQTSPTSAYSGFISMGLCVMF